MNVKNAILPVCLLLSALLFAKNTQTVRGRDTGKTAKYTIIGAAAVRKYNREIIKNTIIDVDRGFRMDEVPYGKYT